MRILRGKSNLEVSSHGFALFVVGLILATFVGGAVRTLLGSDRVHQRIVTELRQRFPKQDIKIGGAEVLLSRGLWPALGLKVRDLSFKQETCDRLSFTLEVPSAVLPINIWSLWQTRPRLGTIELDNGRLHFDYHPCNKSAESQEGAAPAVTKTAPAAPEKVRPIKFEWKEWGQALDGAELNEFAVTYAKSPDWKVQIRNAQIEFSGEFGLHAQMEVQRSLTFGTAAHPVELDARSEDPVLHWSMTSEFKEGRVKWKGSWDSKSQAAMFSLDISQLPIKEALSELYQMGVIEREVEMRTTWISCGANWDGSAAAPAEMPIHVRNCKLEGAYGGVQLDQAELFPLQEQILKVPVELKVQNLQVQPLVQALNRQVLPAVINKLGQWSGVFQFLNKNSWSLEGWLEGAEVVFSNQSVRGKQILRRIHTRAERVLGMIAAKVDQAELTGGEFAGLVEFNLNDDWRSGKFRAQVDNLKFSPAVQNLLLGGTWDSLKIQGAGTLEAGELKEWKGSLESSRILGEGWTADGLNMQSRFVPGVFSIESRLKSVHVVPTWRYYSVVREHLRPKNEELQWSDLFAKIEVRQTGGEVVALSALDVSSGKIWRAKGGWQRDRELVMAVNGFAEGRPHVYSVRSDKGLLSIDEGSGAR